MNEFKKYTRKGFSEMRPYIPGEDLSDVFVAEVNPPELGGMIARDPENHEDQWYMEETYFRENFIPVDE